VQNRIGLGQSSDQFTNHVTFITGNAGVANRFQRMGYTNTKLSVCCANNNWTTPNGTRIVTTVHRHAADLMRSLVTRSRNLIFLQ
jgi:hypothetical protein